MSFISRQTASAKLARGLATVADAAPAVARVRPAFGTVRTDWRRSEIQKIYDGPLMETIFKAVSVACRPLREGTCWRRLREYEVAALRGRAVDMAPSRTGADK